MQDVLSPQRRFQQADTDLPSQIKDAVLPQQKVSPQGRHDLLH